MVILPIIGAVAACLAILTFIWAVARWTTRIDLNTTATERLTQTFEHFVERVGNTLEDHGVRLTKLETRAEFYENGVMKSYSKAVQQPLPED